MEPEAMMSPQRMNSGTASRVKEFREAKTLCAKIVIGTPLINNAAILANPIEYDMGTDKIVSRTKMISIAQRATDIDFSPFSWVLECVRCFLLLFGIARKLLH